ncbi:MAG TPA: UrcA family protein [Steroidobacteraceae bacterium]|nr:UrcA family protein [Steroidobacteraceae bacterium]
MLPLSHRFSLLPLGAALIPSACLLAPAQPARAADSSEQDQAPSVTLHYSRQDLATEAGTQRLYERLVRAARDVCPDAPGDGSLARAEACRHHALVQALRQIHDVRLTELVAAQ